MHVVFENTHIDQIKITSDNVVLPIESWHLDFDNNKYKIAYSKFVAECQKFNGGYPPLISLEEYKRQFCVFQFDLTNDKPSKSWALVESTSNLAVGVDFARPTPADGLTMICVCVYSSVLSYHADHSYYYIVWA